MPIACALVHHATGGFDHAPKPESISNLIEDADQVFWLDILDPDVEDVVHRNPRPKIESYGDYYFIVFYALRRKQLDDINLFIGKNYDVTLHYGEMPEIATTVERWHQNADRIGHDVAVPIYSLLD